LQCCPICLDAIAPAAVATLDACGHVFHEKCIIRWAGRSNLCPVDRQPFCLVITAKGALAVNQPSAEDEAAAEAMQVAADVDEHFDSIFCEECQLGDEESVLLLCDGCDLGHHTFCVDLEQVPGGDWYCEMCTSILFRSTEE